MVIFSDRFNGRPVLVTGHTGFKGSWLCHWLLALGARVTGIGLEPNTSPNLFGELRLAERLDHRIVDIRNGLELERNLQEICPEVILHLAAQPLVRTGYRDPKTTWDTNVGGTVNLLDSVRRIPSVRSIVVVTSDKCYENREWVWGYRECDALGGYDPYSASKGATELVVASFRRSFFADGRIRLASARSGNVIGGGDWSADRIVTDFVASIAAGRPLNLRNTSATRPWQHVLEPLSGYLRLASQLLVDNGGDFSEPWNFGPGESGVTTVRALAENLVAAWGSGTIQIASDAGRQPHEAGLLTLDCSKAASRLGWMGTWTIAQAVSATVDWYRAHASRQDLISLTDLQIYEYTSAASSLPWTK